MSSSIDLTTAYGLTRASGQSGAYDYDVHGAIEDQMPDVVKALETGVKDFTAAAATAAGAYEVGITVLGYVAPDVAAAVTAAAGTAAAAGEAAVSSAEAAALAAGVALLPVAAAFAAVALAAIAFPASGGTGCCGAVPYGYSNGKIDPKLARQQAAALLIQEHIQSAFGGVGSGGPFSSLWGTIEQAVAKGHAPDGYKPSDEQITTLVRFSGQGATAPPCNPAHYSWNVSFAVADDPGTNNHGFRVRPMPEKGSPEEFIEAVIEQAWNANNDCWHSMSADAFPGLLAAAVAAWNNTHWGTSSRTVTLMPLNALAFGDPLSQAAGVLAAKAKLSPATAIRFKVNTGGYISPTVGKSIAKIGKLGLKLAPAKPASTTTKGTTMGFTLGSALGKEPGTITGSKQYDAVYANQNPAWAQAHAAQLAAEGITIPPATSALAMKLGVAPSTPSSAPGMTVAGIPAKTLGITALVAAAAGIGSKLAGWW